MAHAQLAPAATSRLSWQLALGDAIALIAFAAIGRASHGEAAGLAAWIQVAETAAPFLVGWFVAALPLGALRPGLAARPWALLGRTALAWLIACPLGLALRSVIRQSPILITFAIVTFATVLLIMLAWRGAYALASRRAARAA